MVSQYIKIYFFLMNQSKFDELDSFRLFVTDNFILICFIAILILVFLLMGQIVARIMRMTILCITKIMKFISLKHHIKS